MNSKATKNRSIRLRRITLIGYGYRTPFYPLQALPHYQKAWEYRPEDPNYGNSYEDLLNEERDYAKAQPVLEKLSEIRRELVKANPQRYLPDLAQTLNNVGFFYRTRSASRNPPMLTAKPSRSSASWSEPIRRRIALTSR